MAADDDGEVFEITDFTTASDWERFISRVEEILHEWKLVGCMPKPPAPKGAYTSAVWEEKVAALSFSDFQFYITHTWLKSRDEGTEKASEKGSGEEGEEEEQEKLPTVYGDLMNVDNDFPSRAHCICRWYGVQDFVVLAPANSTEKIMTETRIKLLLSSVNIALSDAGCGIPVFVQIHQKWRRLYLGTCVQLGSSVEFSMAQIKRTPPQYSHLAGLLDVFKAKMGSVVDPRPPVSVAVRFLYVLYDWVNSPWSQPLPDFDDEVGYSGFDQLPFGACEDPVSTLQLYCTWPSLSEDMIVDNQVYTDLDPLQAPQWSVRIQMTEDPQCLLGEYLVNFLALCHRKETLDQLIGNLTSDGTDAEAVSDISQALHKLTEPTMPYSIPSLTSYVTPAPSRKPKARDTPIQGEHLDQILQHLFPDAKVTPGDEGDRMGGATSKEPKEHPLIKELSKQLKSAPVDGLLHKLSVCLCVLNQNQGGLFAVAQLWQEFILELRYRWDNSYVIDGVESGPPNLGTCLLQQKLQMLNCCILHKKKREQLHKGYTGEFEPQSPRNISGPSTSKIARSLSQEGACELDQSLRVSIPSSQSDTAVKNIAQSETAAKVIDQSELPDSNMDQRSKSEGATGISFVAKMSRRIPSSSESSDDEFFECDESEKQLDEKDIDTQLENQSNTETENQSEMESQPGNQETLETQSASQSETQNQSDEEMDCDSDNNSLMENLMSIDSTAVKSPSDSMFMESFTHNPEGRLAPFNGLTLVNCEEMMYIPVTQEPAPMTEDMLEEHAEVLAKLGTSAEGAELRARMQSACLLSDMESFKAANPGCVLDDFVRWYSPRDYIDEEVEDDDGHVVSKGHLSLRMQIPGNMWVEVWQTARPVPARRQKRLFDDTREAEKVLHYLSSLKPADVVVHLLPMLVHAALLKAVDNEDAKIPVLKQVLEQACIKASQVTRSPQQDFKKYEELIRLILQAEIIIARNISLKSKFTEDLLERPDAAVELDHFVCSILQNPEVSVRGGPMGPAGSVIQKLFLLAQRASYMVLDDGEEKDDLGIDLMAELRKNALSSSVPTFPRPTGREYILRTIVPRPAPYSKPLPQRMFCSIEEDEFRLAGAFSTDTVFQ